MLTFRLIGIQAATLYAASFLVGAGMEMFMIKTGFYNVATRKEAERRALAQWEREEAVRLQDLRTLERARMNAERERQDLQHYRERLMEELAALRRKEHGEGVKLDDLKVSMECGESVLSQSFECHHMPM